MANPFRQELEKREGSTNPFKQELQRRENPEQKEQQETPARNDPEKASAQSARIAPGNREEPIPGGVFNQARQSAIDAGVNPNNSAPKEARTALAVSAPLATQPEQQAEVVRNALGDQYKIRVGPDTGEVEWREKGSDQFSLINPPGFDLGDFNQAIPETSTILSGVAGGITGFAGGGAVGGPPGALGGTIVGEGVGEAIATKLRLEKARELGYLPDITDEEIFQKAFDRGVETSLFSAGGTAVGGAIRRTIAGKLNAPPKVMEAIGDSTTADEAVSKAKDLQRRAKEVSGEEFPMTTGQTFDSPELRLAEERGAAQGRSQLTAIERQQNTARQAAERNVVGEGVTPEEGAKVGKAFEKKAFEDVRRLEGKAEQARAGLSERAGGVTPEAAAARARGEIEIGRRRLFQEEFGPRYDEIFAQADETNVDLSGLRNTASRIEGERGQRILPSLSLTQQRVLKEAKQAGMETEDSLDMGSNNLFEWSQDLVEGDTTLRELQNGLVDIRRELNKPSIADEPQKASILRSLESELERARSASVGPEKARALEQLDQEYAKASADYNKSFVSQFTDVRQDGTPMLTSEAAFNRVTRSPEEAEAFVNAMERLPNGGEAVSQFKRGIISNAIDKATKNGEISDTALRNYLTEPRRRALGRIFEGEDLEGQFESVANAVEAVKTRRKQFENGTKVIDRVLGQKFTSPTKIADEVFTKLEELTPQRVNTVRSALPKSERGLFDRALGAQVRDRVLDSNGHVSSNKIDEFLTSDAAPSVKSIFGEKYMSNLRTLRDMQRASDRVTNARVGRNIDESLSSVFNAPVGAAKGMQRFLRIPFPPLSKSGRALTASLGQVQERTQNQLAKILADPGRVDDLRKMLSTSVKSKAFDAIAGRVGLSAMLEAKDIYDRQSNLSDLNNEEE